MTASARQLDTYAQSVYSLCMSTKTISLRLEAYERLRNARSHPGESFSDVVMRARWAEEPVTAGELLGRVRERGPAFTAAELDRLEEAERADRPAESKWAAD